MWENTGAFMATAAVKSERPGDKVASGCFSQMCLRENLLLPPASAPLFLFLTLNSFGLRPG